jgi:ribonuclease VapC
MYYIAYREGGQDIIETYQLNVDKFPIQVVSPDQEITRLAAIIKATNKVSYADAFAAALANLKNASLVTGNPEFKQLENDINLIWI